jgi:thymidylate synthase (FAD)
MVIPKSIESCVAKVFIHDDYFFVSPNDILSIVEQWYNSGIEQGYKEEELRYLKPQATEFKAIIGMNAHALMDWFQIRCCQNAQTEIRDMANKMLKLCKDVAPDLFKDAGASCKVLGYCPENNMQNENCQNKIVIKDKALEILNQYKKTNNLENK